jgi:hypothetical protein
MPMVWQPPELFLEHNGVQVFHTYKDGLASTFHYTTDPDDDDLTFLIQDPDCTSHFDVRDLPPAAFEVGSMALRNRHAFRIKAAIEAGILTAPI